MQTSSKHFFEIFRRRLLRLNNINALLDLEMICISYILRMCELKCFFSQKLQFFYSIWECYHWPSSKDRDLPSKHTNSLKTPDLIFIVVPKQHEPLLTKFWLQPFIQDTY